MKRFHKNTLFFRFSLALIFLALAAYHDTSFSAGRPYMDEGNVKHLKESIGLLLNDPEGVQILNDYLLYFAALINCTDELYPGCLRSIDRFLALYPDTPLAKEARLLKIKSLYAILDGRGVWSGMDRRSGEDLDIYPKEAIKTMRRYLKDFPDDAEALYLYAKTLKKMGKKRAAERVFKSLYILANRYYMEIKDEIPSDILTVNETLLLSKNLLRTLRFRESENLLLKALNRPVGKDRKSLYIALADTYFRMKDYKRAALYYRTGGRDYRAAISFYRAGDHVSFETILEGMKKKRMSQTCRLLLLKGLKKRRDGRFNEALLIFRRVYKDFPCRENALWHIGWTEYLKGDFQSASYNFRDLYKRYRDPKYLYWQARSLERRGYNANRLYSGIDGSSFYSFLSQLRAGNIKPVSGFSRILSFPERGDTGTGEFARYQFGIQSSGFEALSDALSITLKRAELLYRAGLRDYAKKELVNFRSKGLHERLKICRYLLSLRAFNESLYCARGIKGHPETVAFLYPVAYGDIVSKVSTEYAVDPFIIVSVMREESRFDEDALSRAGAMGLMQLMPYTAQRIAKSLHDDAAAQYAVDTVNRKDPYIETESQIKANPAIELQSNEDILDPRVNITLGSYYLRQLLLEFKAVPVAVAAYNAGEAAVRRWLKAYQYHDIDEFIEDIPYRETKRYVKKVMKTYFKYIDLYMEQD